MYRDGGEGHPDSELSEGILQNWKNKFRGSAPFSGADLEDAQHVYKGAMAAGPRWSQEETIKITVT